MLTSERIDALMLEAEREIKALESRSITDAAGAARAIIKRLFVVTADQEIRLRAVQRNAVRA
jgi:hypothetical protein